MIDNMYTPDCFGLAGNPPALNCLFLCAWDQELCSTWYAVSHIRGIPSVFHWVGYPKQNAGWPALSIWGAVPDSVMFKQTNEDFSQSTAVTLFQDTAVLWGYCTRVFSSSMKSMTFRRTRVIHEQERFVKRR